MIRVVFRNIKIMKICRSIKRCLQSELKCDNFLFGNVTQQQLIQCRWPIGPWIYLSYRLLLVLYAWSIFIWRVAVKPTKFYKFLTNWGYFVIATNFLVKFIVFIIHIKRKGSLISISETTRTVPNFLVISSWILTNVCSSLALMISLIYWLFLYEAESGPPTHGNIQVHVINSALVLIDISFISIPIRLLHFYQPFLFALIYLIFNVILWFTNQDKIYKILDWERPLNTMIFVAAATVAVIVLHSFLFLISRALDRCKCSRKFNLSNVTSSKDQVVVESIT